MRLLLALWFAVVCGFILLTAIQFPEPKSKVLSKIWFGEAPPETDPVMSFVDEGLPKKDKPNAVIVMLVAPRRLEQAVVAIKNIEDRFNHRLKYPYVIFTETSVSQIIRDKVDWVSKGRVTWAGLPSEMWGPPPFLDQKRIDDSLSTIGFTVGYRSMCRFYSGFFWRHPAVLKYDWIWRLDSDIEFHCDVPYDPIARMQDANALYGFIQISNDARWVQPSLGGNVSAFLAQNRHLLPPGANHRFTWYDTDRALAGNGGDDDWTLLSFYNNFEISHRSLWDNPLYLAYFDYLDRAGGFFYERWGDSLVHSHAVSMSLRADQVMQFADMGYEHQKWEFECPMLDRCTCFLDSSKPLFDNRGYEWFNASQRVDE